MMSLILAYLTKNLKLTSIPLKAIMDEFERSTIYTSLRLTHGNQKNAAAILKLKPTAMFEKMRKYGIQGKQMKFNWENWELPDERLARRASVQAALNASSTS
jgi:hypothetical protein